MLRNESDSNRLRRYWPAALALLVILIPLTFGAIRSFPLYDDSGFQLIVKENGRHAVSAALTNRPFFGWILQKAILSPYYRPIGFALQFVGWALFGVVSMMIWTKLFPDLRHYAPLAGCLTVAPILVKVQLETWLFVVPVNFAVIPAYLAGLLLWRYAEENSRSRILILGASALMTFAGGLLSEYAFLATIACCLLLLSLASPPNQTRRRRAMEGITVLAVSALCAHFVFTHFAVAHPAFGNVSFTPPVSDIIAHLPAYLVRVGRSFWYATAGTYGQALASAAGQSLRTSISVSSVIYPLVAAGAIVLACRPHEQSYAEPTGITDDSYTWPRAAAIGLAIVGTLSPAYLFRPVLVGRDLHLEELGTRCYFVAAPLVVALTLRILLAVSRRRFWYAVPLVLGLLAGDSVMEELHAESSAIQTMKQIGPVLEPYVRANPDQTVVLTPDFYARDIEITYRASLGWPADLSRRLLILWDGRLSTVIEGSHPIRGAGCKDITAIDRNMDTVVRRGKIGQLLWLQPLPNGGFSVEPFCIEGN